MANGDSHVAPLKADDGEEPDAPAVHGGVASHCPELEMKKNATKKSAPTKRPSKTITVTEAELNRVGLSIVRATVDRLRRARDGVRR